MSLVRFVHTDHLRLGTPVEGIAHAPGWLHQKAAGAVRQSVLNIVEAAIANHAQFVLIAGKICETPADYESAVNWLRPQLEPLRRTGIQVVARATSPPETALLQTVCDVVLQHNQSLHVEEVHGRFALTAGTASADTLNRGDGLTITFDQTHAHRSGRMVYNAQPSNQPSAERDVTSRDGYLSLSAGAIQSVGPNEAWDCGCLLIEADTVQRDIESEFLETDVLRFAVEQLDLPSTADTTALSSELANIGDRLGHMSSRPLIVDWHVKAELHSEFRSIQGLTEADLLATLRDRLQSGHRGVWPRRVHFASNSSLNLTTSSGEAVEEYVDVVCGEISVFDTEHSASRRLVMRGHDGIPTELVEGLRLLNRAA